MAKKSFGAGATKPGILNTDGGEKLKEMQAKIQYNFKYIPKEKIVSNPKNEMYTQDGIEALKESILINGLRHNLSVLYNPDNDTYRLVSGERRYHAITNMSDKEYNDIFVNIFDGIEKLSTNGNKKKVLLFGSGNYSKRFLAQFAGQYEVYSIIDNNESKWGTELEGIPINSPDIIKSIGVDDIYFIICIKKYYGVVNQLRKLGVEEYHIYDPGRDYPNKRRENILARLNKRYQNDIHVGDENRQSLAGINILDNKSPRVSGQPDMSKDLEQVDKSEATVVSKPYNIGYIAGVFDLFHIGHLNMFKRAKEMCNYLIVGVVSDEGVRLNKQAEPFVPFEERIEMVRSCRYVDEAVKLPLDFAGTRDMFKVYHFDVQFSGSDYEHNTYWLEEKKFLEENGSTMVFFPYTQSTSSTKLKKAIESRISGVN